MRFNDWNSGWGSALHQVGMEGWAKIAGAKVKRRRGRIAALSSHGRRMIAGMNRRDFLAAMSAAAPLIQKLSAQSAATPNNKVVLKPFDYSGVTLRASMWQRQAASGRDFYFGLSNDDILHGYRVAAGAANAPGRALGGWCSP